VLHQKSKCNGYISAKLKIQLCAALSFVQIFFREERLPIAEGWQRSETPINASTLGPLIRDIAAQSNWTAGEGCHWVRLGPNDPIVRF